MYLQRKLNSFWRRKLKLRHFTRLVITFTIFTLQFCFILHSKEDTFSFLPICVTPIRSNANIHTYWLNQPYILKRFIYYTVKSTTMLRYVHNYFIHVIHYFNFKRSFISSHHNFDRNIIDVNMLLTFIYIKNGRFSYRLKTTTLK